jgi:integrase
MRHFLDVARDDGYNPIWLIALHTGMRRGELLGLRWQDVDPTKGVLHVRQFVTPHRSTWHIGEPKTASGRRTIVLDAACVTALREHRTRQNERRLAGEVWQDYDLVFASEVGTPIDPNNLYHRFLKLVKQAGVPRIPFHGLRHSHATLLMKQGIHPKVASERLGHADISITLQTYSHMLPAMQREAADVFAAAMDGRGAIGVVG